MKKRYKIKPTQAQLKEIKRYYELFKEAETIYWVEMAKYEVRMEKATGIKGIEFILCDGEIVGVGNIDRTMRLIHREELE